MSPSVLTTSARSDHATRQRQNLAVHQSLQSSGRHVLVTTAVFAAEGTTNILVNQYIPLWGCPRIILSDNGLQFFSKLSQAVYQLLGVRKLPTSSYHPTVTKVLNE